MNYLSNNLFSIVVAVYLLLDRKRLETQFSEQLENERTSHAEEQREVTTAINNNTLALTRLVDKLENLVGGAKSVNQT